MQASQSGSCASESAQRRSAGCGSNAGAPPVPELDEDEEDDVVDVDVVAPPLTFPPMGGLPVGSFGSVLSGGACVS